MTRNELIKAAYEAGAALENYGGAWHIEFSEVALTKFAKIVSERCAAIADQYSAPLVAGAIRRGSDGG